MTQDSHDINKYFDRFVWILFLIIFAIYQKEEMFLSEEVGDTVFIAHSIFPFLATVIAIIYSVIRVRHGMKHNVFSILYLFTFALIYVVAVAHNLIIPFQSKLRYITLAMPIVLMLYAYKWRMTEPNDHFFLYSVNVCIVFLLWQFFSLYSLTSFNGFRTMGAYTMLMFLPFALLLDNKIIKWPIMVAIFIALLISLKRGGMLSFVLAVLMYLLVRSIIRNRHLLNSTLIFLGGAIIIGIFVYVDQLILENEFLERLINMQADSGSGRIQVYRDVVDMIKSSSDTEILVGHGWDQVIVHQPDHFSAHNDYLEVFYDCGLLCILPLVALLVSMFGYLFRLIRHRSRYAPAMAALLVIFVFNSTISHIILYPKFISVIALAFGFIMAAEQIEANGIKEENAKSAEAGSQTNLIQ